MSFVPGTPKPACWRWHDDDGGIGWLACARSRLILVNALCADVDFNDDLQSSSGHDIRALVSRPPHDALPTTPLDETILGLKVEVERLVDELFLVRSRAELFASAHVATVAGHAEERAGLVLQATQKGALLALAKRDIKSLTDDLKTCKAKSIELNGQVILNKEEVTLAGMYIRYLEAGHSMTAPPGGIVLQTMPRFCPTTWLALGAVRQTNDLMSKAFLIPEGVRVRPFIAWIY